MQTIRFGENLLEHSWESFPFDWGDFSQSYYCHRLRYWLQRVEVDSRLNSFIHGISHTERVALFGAVISWMERIAEDKADTILLACLYHDIGREDDRHDPKHGKRSAELLRGRDLIQNLTKYDEDLLCAVVEMHSFTLGLNTVCKAFPDLSMDDIIYFSSILIDADVLDRIRLTNSEKLLLSTDSAKQMLKFREEVFSLYLPPKTDNYYYHITPLRNVDSILKRGLKKPRNGNVYLCDSPESCLQLAPCAGAATALKIQYERFTSFRKIESLSFNMALLKVDISGMADKLVRQLNARAEDLLREKKRVGIYEYLLPCDISPDRIIEVTKTSIEIPCLPGQKEYILKLLYS